MSGDGLWDGAEILDRYSREQALADGMLVDPGPAAREAGFRFPVALTAAVWADCVAWDDARERAIQDERGRLWDVLWMTRLAIRRAPAGADRVRVQLHRIPSGGLRAKLVTLEAVVGPGDRGEPVITIQQPGED